MKGTSIEQDIRFQDKTKKLRKKILIDEKLLKPVSYKKINLAGFLPWIKKRVEELLGIEDDILMNFIYEQLNSHIDVKDMKIAIMPFIGEEKTDEFLRDLWKLLKEAEESVGGIPKSFIEERKKENESLKDEIEMKLKEKEGKARYEKSLIDQTREKYRRPSRDRYRSKSPLRSRNRHDSIERSNNGSGNRHYRSRSRSTSRDRSRDKNRNRSRDRRSDRHYRLSDRTSSDHSRHY